jgi:membrane protein DedA with SNARE-associated domain
MSLATTVKELLQDYGYFALGGVLWVAGFGVPIPEDIPLLFSGYLSSLPDSGMNLFVVIAVAMFSILGADFFFYYLGRRIFLRGGSQTLPLRIQKILTPARRKRIDHYFNRYGTRTVFFGRFMPGLRTPIFLCAGLWGVSPLRFIAADGGAAVLSVPALCVVGYLFGKNLDKVTEIVGRVEYAIIGAIVLFVVGSLIAHRIKSKREAAAAAAEAATPDTAPRAANGE